MGRCFVLGDGEHEIPVQRIDGFVDFFLGGFDEKLAVFIEVELILLEKVNIFLGEEILVFYNIHNAGENRFGKPVSSFVFDLLV